MYEVVRKSFRIFWEAREGCLIRYILRDLLCHGNLCQVDAYNINEHFLLLCVTYLAKLTVTDFSEQRVCKQFCLKLEKPAEVPHQMLKQSSGGDAYDWFKRFKERRTSLDDNLRSERPSTGMKLGKCDSASELQYGTCQTNFVRRTEHDMNCCVDHPGSSDEKQMTVVTHPPYLPDLPPCDCPIPQGEDQRKRLKIQILSLAH